MMCQMPSSITPDRLFNRAVHYLERYAASVEGVRAVLLRGLQRAAQRGEVIPDEAPAWVEATLQRLSGLGYLNDRIFAEVKVRSLRSRGASSFKIRQALAHKGVDADLVAEALDGEDMADDWQAAVTFARKRRLGVFADEAVRVERKQKHLAALARAGFSMSLARRIIEAESVEDLIVTER